MEHYKLTNSIKFWAEDDRPRDKLLLKGRSALSDSELIAIILGTGIAGETAVDLGKNLMSYANDNLLELSRFSVGDITKKVRGIGKAKAVALVAALELGNRKQSASATIKEKISCSQDAYNYLRSFLGDTNYEEFWIVILDRANRIKQKVCISEGGFSGTIADPKKIFKTALENSGSSIILAHNHPSGNTRPSDADIQLTKRLKDAGKLLEMPVIDHIIVGDDKYFSFADEGII